MAAQSFVDRIYLALFKDYQELVGVSRLDFARSFMLRS